MFEFLIRIRYATLALIIAALAWLIPFGSHVTYEQSIASFFPPDDPTIAAYRAAADTFGSDNVAFVAYEDPDLLTPGGMDRLARMARAVGPESIPGIRGVQSLDAMPQLWRVDEGLVQLVKLPPLLRRGALNLLERGIKAGASGSEALTVAGAVASAKDDTAREELRRRLTSHPLFRGMVIDATGAIASVVVQLGPTADHDIKATIAAIRERADAAAESLGFERPKVVGPPVLLADGYIAVEKDGRSLAYLGMALIATVMLGAVRSLWWTALPLAAGWAVWLTADHIMAKLGLRISLSGGPLMAQVIVLTMPAASHLAIRFRDSVAAGIPPRTAARDTLALIFVPVFWCSASTALGYAALMTSSLIPVIQFGMILAGCTLGTAALAIALAPVAMLPPFPLEIPARPGTRSILGMAALRLVSWTCRHAGAYLAGVAIVCGTLLMGLTRLEYEPNYINLFKSSSRVVQDYKWVEARLGGIGLFQLTVPLPAPLDGAKLDRLHALDEDVREFRNGSTPAADQVVSLATVLDPDRMLAALPAEQRDEALRIKLGLIGASPQGDLLDSFWNPEAGQARVMVRMLESQPSDNKERLFADALAAAREDFGPSASLTGMSYLLTRTVRGVTATQWSTLMFSAGGVLLMLAIALRGVRLALWATLPTAMAVGLTLGLMGWLNIKLDIATALVASVALGLSVDHTFHCLGHFRRLRLRHNFLRSLMGAFRISGPGVVLSSLAVSAGFFALCFSEFVPFANFGMLIGIAIAGGLLGNLILLPACLTLAWVIGRRGRASRPLDVAQQVEQ